MRDWMRSKVWPHATMSVVLFVCATTSVLLYSGEALSDPNVVPHRSQPNAPYRDNVIAVIRAIRRVSMYYTLDLKAHNFISPQIADVMRKHDDKIRTCYTRRLDKGHNLQGQIALGVKMSRSAGTITHVKRLSGTLQDRHLLKCIKRELVRLPIHPPRDLKGTLIYSFGFEQHSP